MRTLEIADIQYIFCVGTRFLCFIGGFKLRQRHGFTAVFPVERDNQLVIVGKKMLAIYSYDCTTPCLL